MGMSSWCVPATTFHSSRLRRRGRFEALDVGNYASMSGPTSFGSGGLGIASSGSGGFVLIGDLGELLLPSGYVSGTALSGSMTYSGQTLASLGVTPGTYTWTWGSGADADFVELQVLGGTQAVPEPSALALLAAGAAGLAWARRRRRAA